MISNPLINPTPPKPVEYVVISMKRSKNGFSVFWRDQGRGYTTDLDQAGRFPEDEAKGIEEESMCGGDEYDVDIAVVLSDCVEKSRRFVTDDDAHRWFQARRTAKKSP